MLDVRIHFFWSENWAFVKAFRFILCTEYSIDFILLFLEVRSTYIKRHCVMFDILNAKWCYSISHFCAAIFTLVFFLFDDAVIVVGLCCWHNCGTNMIRFSHSIPSFWLEIHFYNLRQPSSLFVHTQAHHPQKRKLALAFAYPIRLMWNENYMIFFCGPIRDKHTYSYSRAKASRDKRVRERVRKAKKKKLNKIVGTKKEPNQFLLFPFRYRFFLKPLRSLYVYVYVCRYTQKSQRKLNKSTVIEIRNWRPGFVRINCWKKNCPSILFVFSISRDFFLFLALSSFKSAFVNMFRMKIYFSDLLGPIVEFLCRSYFKFVLSDESFV